jgi:hypothetical protein
VRKADIQPNSTGGYPFLKIQELRYYDLLDQIP